MLRMKFGGILLEYRMRLDVMAVTKIRWTPYLPQEINGVFFSTYHSLLAYFEDDEFNMLDKGFLRQCERLQGIPVARIIMLTAHGPAKNNVYLVKQTFIAAY